MGCVKSLALNLTQSGEFPMDDAVYVASIDKILGSAGAYIHQCNAATGAREASARVAAPLWGPSRVAYHAADGLVYFVGWSDLGYVDPSAGDMSDNIDLFPIVPASLAVGPGVGIKAAFTDLQSFTSYGLNGVQALLSLGNYLYFAFRYQRIGGQMFRINPNNVTQKNTSGSAGWDGWNVNSIGTDGSFIYHPYPDGRIYQNALDYTSRSRCQLSLATETPVGVDVDGSNAYAVCGNAILIKVLTVAPLGPGTYTTFNLEDGAVITDAVLNVKPNRIKYCNVLGNPHFGKFAIPCQNTDTIIFFDPLAGANPRGFSVSGYDGPVDVVFTPSASFAVQTGPVGLKLIT